MQRTPTETSTTNAPDVNTLKKKALMVRLTTKNLNRNKADKDLAVIVHEQKKVGDATTVRVSKSIFPKERTDKFMKVSAECKNYFYEVTSPWDDRGWRLLAVDIFKPFIKKIKAYTTEYKAEVFDFIDAFEIGIEEMKADTVLGGAFKQTDYKKWFNRDGSVNREELLRNFKLEVEFDEVTTGNDLAASLTDSDKELLAQEIKANATRKFASAQKDIAIRLHKVISKMHERLSVTDQTFRDTLVENVEDLCDIIPCLNIANDPALDKLAKEAKATLCKFDPQTLRDDDVKRKEISDAADKLADNLKGMI
jgi:hypothetical protein